VSSAGEAMRKTRVLELKRALKRNINTTKQTTSGSREKYKKIINEKDFINFRN
jgi:hypothetical protein